MEDGSIVVWPANIACHCRGKMMDYATGNGIFHSLHRMYLIHCEHEYGASKNVENKKFNNRLHNWETYHEEVMDLKATSFFNLEHINLQSSFPTAGCFSSNNKDHPGDNETGSEFNEHDPSFPHEDYDLDNDDKENEGCGLSALTYSEVIGKCTDLVKMIQNDPAKMTKLFVLVENMVKRYQSSHTVEVDICTCPSKSSATTGVVTAITCPVRNAATMKHKKLAREVTAGKRQRKGMVASQFSQANDDDMLLPPKPKTHSCKLCRCQGNVQFACCEITKFGSPLQKGNEEAHSSLAQQIIHQTSFVQYFLEGDKRIVYRSLPKKTIQALIIHNRYVRAGMVQPTTGTRGWHKGVCG
jgi:hypothetical protein